MRPKEKSRDHTLTYFLYSLHSTANPSAVTDEGFLLQTVNNDKQGANVQKKFFSLVQHCVLTSCPSLHHMECVIEKRMKSLPSGTFPLVDKPRTIQEMIRVSHITVYDQDEEHGLRPQVP